MSTLCKSCLKAAASRPKSSFYINLDVNFCSSNRLQESRIPQPAKWPQSSPSAGYCHGKYIKIITIVKISLVYLFEDCYTLSNLLIKVASNTSTTVSLRPNHATELVTLPTIDEKPMRASTTRGLCLKEKGVCLLQWWIFPEISGDSN